MSHFGNPFHFIYICSSCFACDRKIRQCVAGRHLQINGLLLQPTSKPDPRESSLKCILLTTFSRT